jgi:hypothetical protein
MVIVITARLGHSTYYWKGVPHTCLRYIAKSENEQPLSLWFYNSAVLIFTPKKEIFLKDWLIETYLNLSQHIGTYPNLSQFIQTYPKLSELVCDFFQNKWLNTLILSQLVSNFIERLQNFFSRK